MNPGFRTHTKVEEWNARILTPPYLSSTADVNHYTLTSNDKFLILASDGLLDLSHPDPPQKAAQAWVDAITVPDAPTRGKPKSLRVLRRALGGLDIRAVSKQLTVDLKTRWMDDTTITVIELQ
jgi:pyruvate dehydrogenase phosphatase